MFSKHAILEKSEVMKGMNLSQKVQGRFKTISNAVFRFWFSSIAFILATIVEMIAVATHNSWEELILTLGIAGALGIVVQLMNERFFENRRNIQVTLYIASFLFVLGYYIYLQANDFFNIVLRSAVVFSFLLFLLEVVGSLQLNVMSLPFLKVLSFLLKVYLHLSF